MADVAVMLHSEAMYLCAITRCYVTPLAVLRQQRAALVRLPPLFKANCIEGLVSFSSCSGSRLVRFTMNAQTKFWVLSYTYRRFCLISILLLTVVPVTCGVH